MRAIKVAYLVVVTESTKDIFQRKFKLTNIYCILQLKYVKFEVSPQAKDTDRVLIGLGS